MFHRMIAASSLALGLCWIAHVPPRLIVFRHTTPHQRLSPVILSRVRSASSNFTAPPQNGQGRSRTMRDTSTEGASLLLLIFPIFFSLECDRGRAPAPSVCALGRLASDSNAPRRFAELRLPSHTPRYAVQGRRDILAFGSLCELRSF
jgi:hypothetical protein